MMKAIRILSTKRSGHDQIILACIFILILAGLLILSSASSEIGEIKFGDSYYYLKHQIAFGLTIGIALFIILSILPYRSLKKIALFFLLANFVLLILVFTPLGIESGGSSRWIKVGALSVQPSEIMKFSLILYLSAWLSGPKIKKGGRGGEFLRFIIILGSIVLLLFLQPATSTVVILMGTALVIYFASGAKWKYLTGIACMGIISLAILISITPYRLERVLGFLNSDSDLSGQNYQLNQAQIAIGSGGLTGVGYGRSTAKSGYLPAVIDDSIFAVIGQEFGFLGSSVILTVFAIFVLRILFIGKKISDPFGKLILVGVGTLIFLQSFVHIGAISGLLPITGVPLPFISYGGTALATFLALGGLAVNVSKYG